MKSMVARLATVIIVMLLVQGGFYVVGESTRLPEIRIPSQSIKMIPSQFGVWDGEDTTLDPELFTKSEARESADRIYRNRSGDKISIHAALFTDPSKGLYHSPMNCYRSSGWTKLSDKKILLHTANRPDIEVSLSMWELKGEKILVLYWYELGDYSMFERMDLLKVRWAMRGQEWWPPMYKVLMQTQASSAERSQAQLLELAGAVREWLREFARS